MEKKKKSKVMNFEKMVKDFRKYYDNTFFLENKKAYKYTGSDLTDTFFLCCSPTIKEKLTKENIEWEHDDQYRQPIEVFIAAILQLGIQQGVYLCNEEPDRYLYKDRELGLMEKFLKEHFKTNK